MSDPPALLHKPRLPLNVASSTKGLFLFCVFLPAAGTCTMYLYLLTLVLVAALVNFLEWFPLFRLTASQIFSAAQTRKLCSALLLPSLFSLSSSSVFTANTQLLRSPQSGGVTHAAVQRKDRSWIKLGPHRVKTSYFAVVTPYKERQLHPFPVCRTFFLNSGLMLVLPSHFDRLFYKSHLLGEGCCLPFVHQPFRWRHIRRHFSADVEPRSSSRFSGGAFVCLAKQYFHIATVVSIKCAKDAAFQFHFIHNRIFNIGGSENVFFFFKERQASFFFFFFHRQCAKHSMQRDQRGFPSSLAC